MRVVLDGMSFMVLTEHVKIEILQFAQVSQFHFLTQLLGTREFVMEIRFFDR